MREAQRERATGERRAVRGGASRRPTRPSDASPPSGGSAVRLAHGLPRHLRVRRRGARAAGRRAPTVRRWCSRRPDRPRGRGRRLAAPPVAERARALGIALEQPESVNEPRGRELIAQARAARSVVVCAFGALIKEPLLSAHEMLNVHPSLLPRWRGAAPIERAIMAGDERDGRVDHAPHRRPRQRAGVPDRERADRARATPTARSPRACRSSAASCSCGRSIDAAAAACLRRAGRGGRHLRREDRRRGPPARSGPARRSSSSGSCARCTRTSARASRSRTGRCWGCTARAWRRSARWRRRDRGRSAGVTAASRRRGCCTAPRRRAGAARGAAAGRARDGRGAPTCAATAIALRR